MESNIKRINLPSGFIDYGVIRGKVAIFHYSATADRTITELLTELLKNRTLGGFDSTYFPEAAE